MTFLAATINQNVIGLVLAGFFITLLGFLLKRIKQPVIVAYIIAGIIIGPKGLGVIQNIDMIEILGELGLILLLFFIGMEISLPDMVKIWKTSLIGVVIQLLASIAFVTGIGLYYDWTFNRIIIIGFVLALSSSAVVIKLLEDKNELHTSIGQNVLSILIMQDILIVPLLIITELLGGNKPSVQEVVLQVVGSLVIIGVFIYIMKYKTIKLPFRDKLKKDHEAQVFVAILFAFGFAILTSFLGLSAALGAFFGGIIVHAADSTQWFHDSLHSFRVAFVSMFFVSIGMMIDISFLFENWMIIGVLLLSVYVTNHFINTIILHLFCRDWRNSFYGGAMLGQVGELSFIILASAYYYDVIANYAYQLAILTISLSLLISPIWIESAKWLAFRKNPPRCPTK